MAVCFGKREEIQILHTVLIALTHYQQVGIYVSLPIQVYRKLLCILYYLIVLHHAHTHTQVPVFVCRLSPTPDTVSLPLDHQEDAPTVDIRSVAVNSYNHIDSYELDLVTPIWHYFSQ